MPDFTFIATNEQGQVRKGDSKLIRSSCMRGKNERHDSRRAKRRSKRLPTKAQESTNEDVANEDGANIPFTSTSIQLTSGTPPAVQLICSPIMEAQVSDASLLPFFDKVDHRSREIMFKYLTYSISVDLMFPVERFIRFPQMDNYMLLMAQNPALLDVSLLMTSSIHDFVQSKPPSVLTITHLRATLAHLTSLISDQCEKDSLLTIVFLAIALGNVSALFGDYPAASAHIQGLKRIATMKNGKEYLEKFPKFSFKISRLDLSYSLCTGKKPLWTHESFTEPRSWQPYFSGSQPLPPHLTSMLNTPCASTCNTDISTTFPKFTITYNDLRCLVHLVNTNIASGTHMDTDTFHHSIHSIQSRLLELDGHLPDHVAECVRLGMLALLTTTFRLPGPKIRYTYLHKRLAEQLQAVRPETVRARKMVFWSLMMGMVAIFELDEIWLRGVWGRVRGEEAEWDEVRQGLKSAMWIDFIHDEPGKGIFSKFG